MSTNLSHTKHRLLPPSRPFEADFVAFKTRFLATRNVYGEFRSLNLVFHSIHRRYNICVFFLLIAFEEQHLTPTTPIPEHKLQLQ